MGLNWFKNFRRRLFRSIYSKFILIFLGILFISALLTYGVIYHTKFGNLFNEAQLDLIKQTQAILLLSDKGVSREEIENLFNQGLVVSRIVSDLDQTGVTLSDEERQGIEGGESYLGYTEADHVPVSIGKTRDGFVMTTYNLAEAQINGIIDRQKATLVLTLLIGSVLIFFAVGMIVRPIKAMSAATKKVAEGDFDLRLKVKGNDEVAMLARNFNIMTEALSKTDYIHRDFVSNVSHEFKTPIASIKGFGNLLKDPELSEEKRQEYVAIIVDESDRLWKLSTNVLKLSELENGIIGLKKESFSLDETIRRVVLLLQENWEEKNIELEVVLDEVDFSGDPELMAQVMINLFGNAIRYTEEGGRIELLLQETREAIEIAITDSGVGIPPEELEKVFDRFYKVEKSRSTPGTGLGLTISQRIVHLHGGSISVTSSPQKGSCFTVTLPKADDK
jgi:signal transduction histidine kinase